MSKIRKISSIGLAITTTVWLLGGILPAGAATAADIQAQINTLLAQIQALQAQLGATAGTSGGATASYSYTRDLTVGSKGADVTALQTFLMGQTSANWPAGQAATGNFGPKTKAALARYQAAVGLKPAVGYFGPKTRAYIASLAVSATTSVTTSGTATSTTSGTATSTTPSTGVAVALASSNPPAGSLVAGAARVPVLAFTLTAGTSGAATVNEIKLRKSGVISDTMISGAYLVESGKVLYQFSSISSGVIDFAGLNLALNAGQTRTITLAIDPSSSLTAGNTVGFSLNSANDISSVDSTGKAITETGNFPVQGNTMTATTVSNPSLATLTIASSSVGNTVYAGTTGVLVSQWTVTANNNPVNLTSINFRVIGSAAKSDIRNVKLMINGTQVGTTLPTVNSDGTAYFDLTASPVKLQTGNGNMQVYADVMGSPNFNFQFELLNSYDILGVDTQYQVPVVVTINGGTGVQITINQGQITVTADTGTPTGNVTTGASGVALAKFDIYAAGEPVKVKFIDVKFTTNASTTGDWSVNFQNVYLVDDQGVQIGSTVSSIVSGTASGQCTETTTTLTCHFGSSSSNINYIVAANTTRVLTVKSDILSTAAGWTSVTASLPGNSSNLQGQISSQSASSGSATGAALTISSTPLAAAINSAVGTITYAKSTTGAKIGSYVLTASAAEGVNVSNLTITMIASSTQFQNLLVKVGTTQFGTTKNTLSGSDAVTFAGSSPIAIPAGGGAVVDVYADILSSATITTYSGLTTLTSCTGTGMVTFASRSCSPTSVTGQAITVSSGPSITVSLSSATAPVQQAVMGSTGLALATFRFVDTANVEPIKITTLVINASTTSATSTGSFANLKLLNGTTQVAGPVSASSTGSSQGNWAVVFNFTTPAIVPQNGALELQVVGDVPSFTSGGVTDNAGFQVKIASSTLTASTSDVTAYGANSNTQLTSSTVTLSPSQAAGVIGNTITVLRTKLTLSSSVISSTSGRTRSAVDDMAYLTFNADPGYSATVNTINLKFIGVAVSNGIGAFAVDIIDPNTGTDWSSGSAVNCTPGAGNSCTVSFTYTGTNIPTISAGTSKQVKVRTNSTNFIANSSSFPNPTVSILVNANTDLNWGDGTTTNGLSLLSTLVPFQVANVSY